jgi:hypothetical protein
VNDTELDVYKDVATMVSMFNDLDVVQQDNMIQMVPETVASVAFILDCRQRQLVVDADPHASLVHMGPLLTDKQINACALESPEVAMEYYKEKLTTNTHDLNLKRMMKKGNSQYAP